MGIQVAIRTELLKIGEAKGIEKGIEVGKAEGIEVGKAEGIEIGEEKGLKFAVAQLLLKGFSEEQTAELLSVTLEKIKEVAAEIAEGNIPHLSSEEE